MSISWGSYNGHLRVGIDYTISPASPSHADTTVDVTWKFYVGTDGWNFNDTQYLHQSADNWSGTDTQFQNTLTSGSMLVHTQKVTYPIYYLSGHAMASAYISGAYNGAAPTESRTITLPARPFAAPSAPTGVNASSITSNTAVVGWTAPSDDGGSAVDEYELQVDDSAGFGSPGLFIITAPTTSQTAGGLNPNTTYYARVQAHNPGAGWGSFSNTISFLTAPGAPSVPSSLKMTAHDQTSISVAWNASNWNGDTTGASYVADCATDSGFTSIVSTQTVTSAGATFTSLTPGTTYYVRAKAVNSIGSSAESTWITAATLTSTTYNDTGDFVTLVDHLASAVGAKLVQLGCFTEYASNTQMTIANDTPVNVTPNILVGSRGPNNPAFVGSGNDEFTIKYPGMYSIEFGFMFDEGASTTGILALSIMVNGQDRPISTSAKHGVSHMFSQSPASSGGTSVAMRIVKTDVWLDLGDTVGFYAYQNTGASMTQPVPSSTTTSYCKVTMTGF